MKKSKSYYLDPNRKSNWFKPEIVPARELAKQRQQRYEDLVSNGSNSFESMVRALEITTRTVVK